MKREIKFRAWDKDMNEMVKVSGIQFEPHSPYENPCIIDEFNDIRDLSDIELMQFPGLTNKDGKDIYEGDIIKEGKSIGIVKFEEGRFMIDWFKNDELWSDTIRFHYIKSNIIGNIYENPELLKH